MVCRDTLVRQTASLVPWRGGLHGTSRGTPRGLAGVCEEHPCTRRPPTCQDRLRACAAWWSKFASCRKCCSCVDRSSVSYRCASKHLYKSNPGKSGCSRDMPSLTFLVIRSLTTWEPHIQKCAKKQHMCAPALQLVQRKWTVRFPNSHPERGREAQNKQSGVLAMRKGSERELS